MLTVEAVRYTLTDIHCNVVIMRAFPCCHRGENEEKKTPD